MSGTIAVRPMRPALTAIAALLLAGCELLTGSDGSGRDEFDGNSLSKYSHYSESGSGWALLGGELVGTGPAIQSVLVRNGVSMTDGWVEVESRYADDGGVVARYQSGTNYYLLAFRDDAAPSPRGFQNLALYHRVPGAYHEFWSANVTWPRGTPARIRMEMDGGQIRVIFNGEVVGIVTPAPQINDPAPYLGEGAIGVRHYGADPTWITRINSLRWKAND